jgi:hypothetical protein
MLSASLKLATERSRHMQRDHAYRKLQDLLLQELQRKQLLPTSGAVEDFIRLADAKGFYVDDLIRMVRHRWANLAGLPHRR